MIFFLIISIDPQSKHYLANDIRNTFGNEKPDNKNCHTQWNALMSILNNMPTHLIGVISGIAREGINGVYYNFLWLPNKPFV